MNISTLSSYRERFIKALVVMKLVVLLIALACFKVSASVYAQTITLNEKNAPLSKVFKIIEQQSGYSFFYNNEVLRQMPKVNIAVKEVTLSQALDQCLEGLALRYEIVDNTIIVKAKDKSLSKKVKTALSLPVEVKGKVTDTTGAVLPGAAIHIKGSNKAYTADSNGEFSFSAQPGDEVTVSFIGYSPYIMKVSDSMPFQEVVLRRINNALDQVVVSTGYQTLPKERATGSFTTVNNQLYNQQVGTDILSRLEYIANGVSVYRNNSTATNQLMVRGISTINGPTSPLIVVDNFPYEGNINNLNPNDVESVTVLKDAAAASIWGTKAGNGVIVITTKKGKVNQPLKLSFNSSVTISNKPDLDYLTLMSSADYIAFEKDLYSRGYYNNQINSAQYPVVSPVVQLLVKAANGSITPAQAEQQINSLTNNDTRDDFEKFIYQKAVNQQYHIDLSGGNGKSTYLFSVGYNKDISNLAAKYERLNLRSNASFNPVKGLQLTTGLTYTKSNNRSGKTAFGYLQQPYQMLADTAGNPLSVAQTYSQAFKDNAAKTGQLLDWNYYPLTDYQHNYTLTGTQDILLNFGANYQILKGLSIDVKYQFEKQLVNASTTYNVESYFARNLINSYTQVNGSSVTNPIPKGGILDLQNSTLTASNLRGQLNYSRDWGKHSVSMIAGEELREVITDANRTRNYGYNNSLLTTSPVTYSTTYPNYVTKSLVAIPYNNSLSQTRNRFVSFYANGAYTYDKKYTLSGSMRRDASNLFGVNTNDKWTPLWSTGVSWDISEENFYSVKAISNLKLRATYGYSGNVDPSRSAVTTISYLGTSIYTSTPYAQVRNFSNPSLRWEKVGTFNLGMDFRFKGDRIYGSIDYYRKKSTDLYATVPVDYTVGLGIATLTKNVASMQGNGVDVEINSLNIDGSIKWLTNFNVNYYSDKVTKYTVLTTAGSIYTVGTKNPVLDRPVWGVYSYRWAGLSSNGNPQGILNGQISENYASLTGSGTQIADLVYNGPRFPVFYGTLGNTLSYKGLSFTARVTYNFGNYFKRQSVGYATLASSVGHADYSNRWQKPGDENTTNVPAFNYPINSARDNFYAGAETLIEKADCIRLQYITVAYDLSKKHYHWLPFNGLQVYLNANNLGIIWRANDLGIDPDYTSTTTLMPPAKNIAIGIRANL
ncbi:SusC/RagA family TonB-linked outer membrane protein [Flavobacterium sp. Sd200]|uniref:SusC/RagA family TonB-linked outer membrane protein n=1 Tax=Flavobacterium sp. Sd200 TaxID=2692211 RepID=UPI00136CDA7D|nr:SusC/RagA family TonB-linked outer membrane protein [Flavobacterium sp. Sd200]MXN91145.1 SusC/RagA family TonB-linked outer membrane protein [Flavobacterium sp. Sd200]